MLFERRASLPRPTLSDIRRVCREFKQVFGRYPNLLAPRRFNEKMQWRKLFDLNPIHAVFCDKIASRDYIAARVGHEVLPELLWVGDVPEEIPFDSLAAPYALKCSCGSGCVVLVHDDGALDRQKARESLRAVLSLDYGRLHCEPGYRPVPSRLLAERLLVQPDGKPPLEHKLFVFNGRVRAILTIVVQHDLKRLHVMHDTDWNCLGWRNNENPRYEHPLPKPAQLQELIVLAECLAAGLDHLRVDTYVTEERVYVGELTPYNQSGFVPFEPDEADFLLGSYWHIRAPARRALASFFA